MKKKLLLYLSQLNHPANIPIASTLAWLGQVNNCLFDNYYDSYHLGVHFPGGDPRSLELGQQTGGTVTGDRHFEELYFILSNFETFVISATKTIFHSCLENMAIPSLACCDPINVLYEKAFKHFDHPFPAEIVMVGSDFDHSLAGLDSYLYPEIFYRRAVGIHESISDDELAQIYREGSEILCLFVKSETAARLSEKGYNIHVVDELLNGDDYLSITKRLAVRWKETARGWILGDPILVQHWLPKACEEDLIAIYGIPQEKIIHEANELISSKGRVIYGRQYSDRDFFELSKLNQCLQVIDPCRPPFQSVKHVEYTWRSDLEKDGFYAPEYDDDELRRFAREGKILISLIFWSGMIREIANFYNLMELFTITKLKCGLVLTAPSYEYMMHAPLELLTIPLEQGGVFPLVEPLLGSCGVGVGIESSMDGDRLNENLENALARIQDKVKNPSYIPRGWWSTMDVNLEKHNLWTRPKPLRFMKYAPYVQVRFHQDSDNNTHTSASVSRAFSNRIRQKFFNSLRPWIRRLGLSKYFQPYRPYEFYGPGSLRNDVVKIAKSVGLEYMFTKAAFNGSPASQYLDDKFIALNYTAGQWDGWTPFETVNDVADLAKAERHQLRRKKPGWIVSTIDSCLWTFSGEFWKRGSGLYKIAKFCADGGQTKQLINVKPHTISRYARILAQAG